MRFRTGDRRRGARGRLILGAVLWAGAACAGEGGTVVVGAIEFATPAGALAPALTAAGDTVVLSWLEPEAGGGHVLRVATRTGGAWRPGRTVAAGDAFFANWADVPSVLPLRDGRWLAHWLEKTAPGAYAYHVRMAWSADGGQTWGEPFRLHSDTSPTEHGFVALLPAGNGADALWLDGRHTGGDGPMTLRHARVTATGPAAEVEVDAQVCDCCQTALVATTHGALGVFRDREDGEIRDIAARRLVDGAWSEPVVVSADGWHYPGCPVNGPAAAARGDSVAVVWYTGADDTPRVYAAFSFDGGATFGPRIRVDDGRPAGRVDVTWWEDAALASWIEETADAGDVRVRRVRPNGRTEPATVVTTTSAARSAGFPRLAPVGGGVVVAWTQPGEGGGVRVATLTRAP